MSLIEYELNILFPQKLFSTEKKFKIFIKIVLKILLLQTKNICLRSSIDTTH